MIHFLQTTFRPEKVRSHKIVIFGDSHSALYAASPGVRVCHLGPITMHRVGRDGIALFGLEQHDLQKGDTIGFVFGEIDIRVHIAPQVEKRRSEAEVIETLVGNYLRTLRAVKMACPGSRIVIFSSVPPSGKGYFADDAAFPRNGSDADRARWARLVNAALRKGTARPGYAYVDQYSMFADQDGLLALDFTHDGTHIRPDHAWFVDTSRSFSRTFWPTWSPQRSDRFDTGRLARGVGPFPLRRTGRGAALPQEEARLQ